MQILSPYTASLCPSIFRLVSFLLAQGSNQCCDTSIQPKAWGKCVSLLCVKFYIYHNMKLTCPAFSCSSLLLQYNSVNMKNKTAEEVYVEMLKPSETVTFKVQHRPDDFSMLKDVPGDGFYVRYMYAVDTHILHTVTGGCFMCYNDHINFLKRPHLCPCRYI